MHEALLISLLVVGGYLLGSIPTAVWVGKLFFGKDVRDYGSGNAGATNVLRVFGTAAAIPVFIIDAAKGYGAVMLAWFSSLAPVGGAEFSEHFVFLRITLMVVAILGHIFPIFASFKGGKGVATIAGCLIAISPLPLAGSFTVFVILWSITSYLSLGSIFAGITFPIWTTLEFIVFGDAISPTMVTFSILVGSTMVYTHRANIKRLKNGSETKTYLFRK